MRKWGVVIGRTLRTGIATFTALALFSGFCFGTDLSGLSLFDGQLLSETFNDVAAVQITANPWDSGDPISGTIDLAGDTYWITGLEAKRYSISVYLDRTPPTSEVWNPGDLRASPIVEPEDPAGSIQKDLDLRYTYRVLSPIDSTLPAQGSGHDCTAYPVSVLDNDMTELGSETYDLRPFENLQVNHVAREIGGADTVKDGIVTVTATSGTGRIGAYISVVDNATGDPTYIVVAPQSPIGG